MGIHCHQIAGKSLSFSIRAWLLLVQALMVCGPALTNQLQSTSVLVLTSYQRTNYQSSYVPLSCKQPDGELILHSTWCMCSLSLAFLLESPLVSAQYDIDPALCSVILIQRVFGM